MEWNSNLLVPPYYSLPPYFSDKLVVLVFPISLRLAEHAWHNLIYPHLQL